MFILEINVCHHCLEAESGYSKYYVPTSQEFHDVFVATEQRKSYIRAPFLLTLVDLSGKAGRKAPGEGLPRSLMALSAFELVRLRICLRIPKGFNSHKDARPQKWAINDNLWSQDSLGSFGSEP